jgi:hypothetical protein
MGVEHRMRSDPPLQLRIVQPERLQGGLMKIQPKRSITSL